MEAMQIQYMQDPRIVMTLDAGGTYLKFSAIRTNQLLVGPIAVPSEADDLERCLSNIVEGFRSVKDLLPEPPVAISFAFPGPADYPAGIMMNVGNLPAFRGAVPLGPILEEAFKIPVFINNDGDLFVYGEAIAGFLPFVNGLLAAAGGPKRYKNLFGLTLGTGLGGGFVRDGELWIGDNSAGGEAWLLRNKLDPAVNAEEGASIRAVRRVYARECRIPIEAAPEPKEIFEIGMGRAEGNRQAAVEAFRQLGEVSGDALAQALTLVDGLAVIGGGISGAHPLFLAALVEAANAKFEGCASGLRRLIPRVFNLEDAKQRQVFLKGEPREIAVPGSKRVIHQDSLPRTAVGISRLGTSEAVAIGAYAFALRKLSQHAIP
jgi:glucokinase